MNERINPSVYFDSELALSEKKYFRYALFCVGNFFVYIGVSILVVPIVLAAFSVPIQGIFEGLYWLKSAEWPHYSWAWLLGDGLVAELTSTTNVGSNLVIKWLLNTWISIPFSGVGLLIFSKLK